MTPHSSSSSSTNPPPPDIGVIVGAGLSGLIAAHFWPRVPVVEAAPAPSPSHKALLRFRTDAVSNATGVAFRRVTVRKGISYKGSFTEPNIGLANMYAQKVLPQIGALSDGERSVWNLAPAERWIAPPDFYERLVNVVGERIRWGTRFNFQPQGSTSPPVLNTTPLPGVLREVGIEPHGVQFERTEIVVERHRIAGCDLYQTIYFPDPAVSVYRASITGDTLIVEHAGAPTVPAGWVLSCFGIPAPLEFLDTTPQQYGKIIPLPTAERKALLLALTEQHCVYSLGRFATWRNVLLDDVVQDIRVIKRLLTASEYDRRMKGS